MVVIYFILGIILKIITAFFALLIWMSDALLGIVLTGALAVQDMDSVNIGWSVARDTINMFFVIFLLVIAFATILRIEAYQYKQLLPKLILSILLVNFSRTICSVLIEFSNVLTRAFLNFSQGQETAAGIASLMGIHTVWDIDSEIGVGDITSLTMLLSMLLVTIFMGGLAIAFAGLTGMMITRTIALLVLVVLSPIAFGMNVLPVTSTYFKKWWDEFIKYLFYGPIAAFCIYLAAIVAADASTTNTAGFEWEGWASNLNTSPPSLPGAQFTQAEFLWEYALVVGLLFLGIAMIKEGGGMGAKITMDFAKKGMVGGAKLAGAGIKRAAKFGRYQAGRKGVKSFADKQWNKGGIGKVTGGLLKAANWGAKATQLPAAWKAQSDKDYSEADALQTGWARDRLNKMFGRKEVSYEDQNFMNLVDEDKSRMKKENPSNDPEYLVEQMATGNEVRSLAAQYLLMETRNGNEMARRMATDEKFGEGLGNSYEPNEIRLMFEKKYGEEKGRKEMLKLAELGKQIGDWSFAQHLKVDMDGQIVTNDEWVEKHKQEMIDRGEDPNDYKGGGIKDGEASAWAGEFAKRGSTEKTRQARYTFNQLDYDEKTGEEKVTKMRPGYKKFLEGHGWGSEDSGRLERNMGSDTKRSLLDKNSLKEALEVVKKQYGDKNTRGRAENNVKFYKEVAKQTGGIDGGGYDVETKNLFKEMMKMDTGSRK